MRWGVKMRVGKSLKLGCQTQYLVVVVVVVIIIVVECRKRELGLI
jgi:hypothetical protein